MIEPLTSPFAISWASSLTRPRTRTRASRRRPALASSSPTPSTSPARSCTGARSASSSTTSGPARRRAGRLDAGLAGSHDDELVDRRLGAPELAAAAELLPHCCSRARQPDGAEALRARIEADDRVRAEVGQPDDVAVVDVHRIWLRSRAGQAPLAPAPGCGVVHRHLPRVPLAHPDAAARVCPGAACALPACR